MPRMANIVKNRTANPPVVVLTIGHSTRELDVFLHLLQAHGVTRLVDVRTIPRSRHNPQFNMETLPAALRSAGIGYVHMPGLGGLRHTRLDSPNGACATRPSEVTRITCRPQNSQRICGY